MNLDDYREVYIKYYRLACKVAYDTIHDYEAAKDVAQEVFTEMIGKLDRLDDKEKLKHWVALYSTRRAVDYIRNP